MAFYTWFPLLVLGDEFERLIDAFNKEKTRSYTIYNEYAGHGQVRVLIKDQPGYMDFPQVDFKHTAMRCDNKYYYVFSVDDGQKNFGLACTFSPDVNIEATRKFAEDFTKFLRQRYLARE